MFESFLIKILIRRIKVELVKKLAAALKAKAAGSLSSSTMGVAGLIVAAGGTLAVHPEYYDLIPEKYRGLVIAGMGVAVALARMRTL
jgi:hypothetical protein